MSAIRISWYLKLLKALPDFNHLGRNLAFMNTCLGLDICNNF